MFDFSRNGNRVILAYLAGSFGMMMGWTLIGWAGLILSYALADCSSD